MAAKTVNEYVRTLKRLHQTFGATVLFTAPEPPESLTRAQRIVKRWSMPQSFEGHAWYPPAGQPSQCAFIWDWAMGPEQDLPESQRWRERTAKLLRQVLGAAGFDRDLCTFISLSRDDAPIDPSRLPPPDRVGLRWALEAADTRYVVLVGSHAQKLWHPGATLEGVAGRVGAWATNGVGWWVMPIHHPNAVFRELVSRDEWRVQLARFRQRIDENEGAFMLDWQCANGKCGAAATMYDEHGLGWCDEHLRAIRTAIECRPKIQQRESLFNTHETT